MNVYSLYLDNRVKDYQQLKMMINLKKVTLINMKLK